MRVLVFFSVIVYPLVRKFVSTSPTVAIQGEISNNPVPSNFLRRALHATVVLGTYLYIDGGEFSQLIDGSPDIGQVGILNTPYCRQNNFTLSIDLSSSWTNATVAINLIPKGPAPILNKEVLWKTDANSCFSWAGEISGLVAATPPQAVPPRELWAFVSNGTGAGSWSQTTVSDSTFSQFLRRSSGSGATIGETCYYIGGEVSTRTDPLVTQGGNVPQFGAVVFNSSSNTWENQSSGGLNTYGTILNSEVVTIPAFGLDGRGLLVVLGGQDPGIASDGSNTLLSLGNITIYDPYIDRWFAQSASGAIPDSRENFCAVAIKGDDGTYEIFIYGGLNSHSNEDYADVYVLTIPGFTWFQAPRGSGTPRFLHACEVVGGRQLISIGGIDSGGRSWDWSDVYQVPDPFTQGIGIFDMTAMEWMPSYNANAAAYESPEVVKEWYAQGNQESVQWQSKEIARMFIRNSRVSVSPTPGATLATAPTSAPNNDNCNLDTKTLALSITTSFLGLIIAAASAWIGWKQYQQKRLKTKQPHSRNETSSPNQNETNSPNQNATDTRMAPTSTHNTTPVIPSTPEEVGEDL